MLSTFYCDLIVIFCSDFTSYIIEHCFRRLTLNNLLSCSSLFCQLSTLVKSTVLITTWTWNKLPSDTPWRTNQSHQLSTTWNASSKNLSFKHRLCWKAHFFDWQPDDDYNQNEKFEFKSELCPPQHEGLNAFEANLYELARSIQFKKVHNTFLSKLSQDVKRIAGCTSLWVPADKTINLYKVGITDYKKLLHDNVIVSFKNFFWQIHFCNKY